MSLKKNKIQTLSPNLFLSIETKERNSNAKARK